MVKEANMARTTREHTAFCFFLFSFFLTILAQQRDQNRGVLETQMVVDTNREHRWKRRNTGAQKEVMWYPAGSWKALPETPPNCQDSSAVKGKKF